MNLRIIALYSILLLNGHATALTDDEWGIWFFSKECNNPGDGYEGLSGDQNHSLTCTWPVTSGPDFEDLPGPFTNIVTENFEELGIQATLWNDTNCRQLITIVDTDGCNVLPEYAEVKGVNIGPK
ncbi:hypothetical protein GGR57DRAFT_486630 [Xylariaceae sp. FL1272]|nr:hypothetical protein GGR57DRAFT_486630 [Xylariaceae sp. FL1272]